MYYTEDSVIVGPVTSGDELGSVVKQINKRETLDETIFSGQLDRTR